MTVTEAALDSDGTSARSERFRVLRRLLLRWAIIVGLVAFAYHDTVAAVFAEIRERTLLTYLPVALVLVLIAAIGVSLREKRELPIYDRQTDVIVGGILVVLAGSLDALLNSRYDDYYLSVHIDILSLWVFLLSACILMFGLRPTARYRWVWLLALSIFPMPFRVTVLAFGSERYASGIAVLLLAVGCSAVAVGRSRRHALIGALISGITGAAVLLAITIVNPELSRFGYMAIPSVAAALVTVTIMYLDYRRDPNRRRLIRRDIDRLTAPNVIVGPSVLTVAAVLISLNPAPDIEVDRGQTHPNLSMSLPFAAPAGWKELSSEPLEFTRYYGRYAHAVRQKVVQTEGDLRFDKQARPRTLVVDAITTDRPITLDVYHPAIVYDTTSARRSRPQTVFLDRGIAATLNTVVDDKRVLTFNVLRWRWNNGPTTMQVTVISVDNHLPDAPFPQPADNPLRIINPMLTILLRGNSVTIDETPLFKDRDLLMAYANGVIRNELPTSSELK